MPSRKNNKSQWSSILTPESPQPLFSVGLYMTAVLYPRSACVSFPRSPTMCSKRVKIDDDNDGSGSGHLCHAKLPPETWSEIWSLLASLEDRIAISLVCSHWRAIALADHQLWAHLSVHLERLSTYDINDEDERERLLIEEKTAAARWLRNAELALDRTCTALITLDIRIDHHEVAAEWLAQLCALLNLHASHIARLWLHLVNPVFMNAVISGLESSMPLLRVLGLALSYRILEAVDVPFALFPNLKEFAGRPCSFLDFKASESLSLETVSTVRGDVETCADLTALLRTFPVPNCKYLDLRISYAYKWEEPDEEDTDYYRSCFKGVDRLDLTWGWNSYAKTRTAIPTTRRPPFIFIGLHERLDSNASQPEEEVCMGIEDAFCDLKPHSSIALRLEPCDPAWGNTSMRWQRDRKPICVTVHNPESLQTRQVAIHYLMLYQRPGPMKVLGARLSESRSLITSLTVPWDLMGMLMRQLLLPSKDSDGLRTITQLTLIVTRTLDSREEEETENLEYWPALPALRHVTLKTPYSDPSRLGGGYKLTPTLFRSAVERLIPPPAKLETLSLHHVGTGYRHHSLNRNSVRDLATRVYGLHIYHDAAEPSTE
ncbi:hypothetical protein EXIGLDRAFT_728631 [Exidia glandulosa HHB12029]|uniref:F-box domain-containing protein n=1 Tax=Exidia glandulosa HHB12029 TaxID=1314781 RepID=A0A165Q5U7_EXIGL|nr:hypothetical protein EXIGLDRAFT_728631 [Exidia glandulosa HHB12029]